MKPSEGSQVVKSAIVGIRSHGGIDRVIRLHAESAESIAAWV